MSPNLSKFYCNLLMLSGTSPCVSNRRAGGWETAGRNPDGAEVSFFLFLFFFTQTTQIRSTAFPLSRNSGADCPIAISLSFPRTQSNQAVSGRRPGLLKRWSAKTTCFCRCKGREAGLGLMRSREPSVKGGGGRGSMPREEKKLAFIIHVWGIIISAMAFKINNR